jgi:RND family efflux transporter MFP subunit
MALLVIALAALGCRRGESKEEEKEKAIVTVKVAAAELADVDLSIRAPATIFPREKANISSSITAPIRSIRVRKGDTVSKGQVLAVLEDRDLIAQKGEAVAAVRQAQVLRERRSQLYEQGAIPHRDLLQAETDLAQSRARQEKVEAQIRFTELVSPFAGVIVEQFLYPGDMVKPDTPVFTVVDMGVAVARAQVPEAEVTAVKRGQRAVFGAQDVTGMELDGTVTMVNQSVDPARRTVEVWCEIPNKDGRLRDGVFGHVTIVTETRPKRVVVPRAAVQFTEGADKGTVMVVDDKKIAHKREIETAGGVGDRVAVSKGLAAGEKVVTEAGYGLPDGTEVKLSEDGAK